MICARMISRLEIIQRGVKCHRIITDLPLVSICNFYLETPYGNVDDTYQYFKELLLCHSVKVGIQRQFTLQ